MKVVALQKKVNELEGKVQLFGKSLEKYKADELFDSLTDHGDPFPLLATLPPDDLNLPLRVCVGDMASEYCKYHYEEEAFCTTIKKCVELYMEPAVCRPAVCPLKARGCRVTSACLQTSVIEEYKKELTTAATTTTAATGGTASNPGAQASAQTMTKQAQADVGYGGDQRVLA